MGLFGDKGILKGPKRWAAEFGHVPVDNGRWGSFKDLDGRGMRAIRIMDHCPGCSLAYGEGGAEA